MITLTSKKHKYENNFNESSSSIYLNSFECFPLDEYENSPIEVCSLVHSF